MKTWTLQVGYRQTIILEIVRQRQRNAKEGVLPVTVQAWLDEYRAEQTLRRDMAALWRAGLLERIGGERCRKGYRVI
jgi:DeoR/GlpR family transcriptional regulator of sugar metabolism